MNAQGGMQVAARRFENQVALVTGGGTGIGQATALLLAREGCAVGVLGRRPEPLDRTVRAILDAGGHAIALPADVSKSEDVHTAVRKLIAGFGRLDIVFANAGINGVCAPIDRIEPDEWDQVIDINLRGTFLTLKYCVPELKRHGGAVVIHSSLQGTRVFSNPGRTAYACTKAAEVAMAKMLALELAEYNVRVNVICTGPVHGTEINGTSTVRDMDSVKICAKLRPAQIPLNGGRPGRPEEVAALVSYLASSDALFVTGTEVYVDGGMSLVKG